MGLLRPWLKQRGKGVWCATKLLFCKVPLPASWIGEILLKMIMCTFIREVKVTKYN